MADRYDLVIVGMGSGGMVAAEFAATLDLKVAVVERSRVGGDCLWTGCVPSKALLAAGKVAHHMRTAADFGIAAVEPQVDPRKVWERIRSVQQQIAATDDNPDRFRDMGIDLVMGHAKVTGTNTVLVEGDDVRELETRYTLLCTGSRPVQPAIEGLEEAGYVTSENLFELTDPPASFVNIGGGPIAVEMVQGFTRLGIPVTLLQKGPRILPRDEPALVELLVDKLRKEGVDLRFDVDVQKVTVEGGKKIVHGTEGGAAATWEADELLVAVGRAPNVENLGLDDLGIETTPKGVVVDNRGRTSVETIYACGDIAGRYLFTHSAAYEGVRAVRDMFFPGKGKVVASVPWATFTDPELAHTGLTESEAREKFKGDVDVWRMDLEHNDRARADGASEGAIIVITHKKVIVGAHILAPAAGEMIHEFALAIEESVGLSELSQFMHVYPTVSTSIGQLAGEAAFEKAEKLRWLVKRK
jgi:pyruvate/2-oxoglutarate dehydrogenase complex dihydrolipoamide dehydrogenase (E3) component